MSRVRITQKTLMRIASPTSRISTTPAVSLKMTTPQTILTAAPTKLMESFKNGTMEPDNITEASALRNELLALMVLLCLLILGVIIYFVFRSMVYIKKVSFIYTASGFCDV